MYPSLFFSFNIGGPYRCGRERGWPWRAWREPFAHMLALHPLSKVAKP